MNTNPRQAPWLKMIPEINSSFDSIKRIDNKGLLYSIDYNFNYYHPVVVEVMKKIEQMANFKPACSAFTCQNHEGDNLHVRNYDFGHFINNDKSKEVTGLNVVVHTKPQGKYESIGLADAFFLDFKGNLYHGCLDDGKSDISTASILPYICMDGINEKGLVASILMVILNKEDKDDIKTDMNEPNKLDKISHTRLIRYILDNCATTSEAVELASKYNIFSLRYSNFQLFISDKDGNSEVLNWRYNKFSHVKTNVITNFNLSGDKEDGCDVIENNRITSPFIKLDKTLNKYFYGYGKGHDRFASLVSNLERYALERKELYKTDMSDTDAMNIIQSVSVFPSKIISSCTQYSVLYNSNKKNLKVWVHQDNKHIYEFKI